MIRALFRVRNNVGMHLIGFHAPRASASHKPKVSTAFVKSRVPVLASLLRSDAQGDLLALLILQPEKEYTLTKIARRVGVRQLTRVAPNSELAESMLDQARAHLTSDGRVRPCLRRRARPWR
jgi:hypothetical protein